jgi:glutamine amidotransferase
MEELRKRGLVEAVLDFIDRDRPFLGICVGMQMMMEQSEEFGLHRGLGLIKGVVRAIPCDRSMPRLYKVPHIGWSSLTHPSGVRWDGTILEDYSSGDRVYFVHSYTAVPDQDRYRLADCDYHGIRVSAAVRDSYRYGCQFHPEKSGPTGIGILSRFLSL